MCFDNLKGDSSQGRLVMIQGARPMLCTCKPEEGSLTVGSLIPRLESNKEEENERAGALRPPEPNTRVLAGKTSRAWPRRPRETCLPIEWVPLAGTTRTFSATPTNPPIGTCIHTCTSPHSTQLRQHHSHHSRLQPPHPRRRPEPLQLPHRERQASLIPHPVAPARDTLHLFAGVQ